MSRWDRRKLRGISPQSQFGGEFKVRDGRSLSKRIKAERRKNGSISEKWSGCSESRIWERVDIAGKSLKWERREKERKKERKKRRNC
jgi:hypothetical protein